MVEIFAYALGIMYSPGPVNLISLSSGLNGHTQWRFNTGVGCAMLILFLLFGFTGAWLVTPNYQLVISLAGSTYIAYLAFKLGRAHIQLNSDSAQTNNRKLGFHTGLMMQLLNPKSFIAILPIVSVQFPAAQITGLAILFWSTLLAILAFGAPSLYMLMGKHLGKRLQGARYFRFLNLTMAILLFYVAVDIAYQHVYLVV